MDINELEKIQNEFEKLHNERFNYIKERLGLYITNYHFKKGQHINDHTKTMEKVAQDKNEILNYFSDLQNLNKKIYELLKLNISK